MSQPFDPDAYLASKSAAPAAPRTPQLSKLQAAAAGWQPAGLPLGDELGALYQARAALPLAIAKWAGGKGSLSDAGKDLLDTYREARAENRYEAKLAPEQHPGAYYSSLGLSSVAAPPVLGAGRGLKALAKTGALMGGAAGLASSEADLTRGATDQAALDTGLGALGGAATGVALPLAGRALSSAWRGVVKPSEAARVLQRAGVKDLTIGQMAPGSMLAQFEEAGQSVGGAGPIIASQRQAGRNAWQNAVLERAQAPGAERLPAAANVQEKLARAYESFDNAYAPIKAAPLPAGAEGVSMRQALGEAFEAVPQDPAVLAPEQTRNMVQRYLGNQATILDRVPARPGALPSAIQPAPPSGLRQSTAALTPRPELPAHGGLAAAGPVDALGPRAALPRTMAAQASPVIPAEALLAMRSNVRQKIRQQLSGQNPDYASAELLERGEQVLDDALERYLPPAQAKALRAIDAQYAKHKVVADAVGASRDAPGGFTPAQLSSAVAKATEKGAYSRGAGGALRELATAGQETLNARSPPTGARILSIPFSSIPGASHASGLLSAAANTSPVKRGLLGEYGWQRGAASIENQLQRAGMLEALQRAAILRASTRGD